MNRFIGANCPCSIQKSCISSILKITQSQARARLLATLYLIIENDLYGIMFSNKTDKNMRGKITLAILKIKVGDRLCLEKFNKISHE